MVSSFVWSMAPCGPGWSMRKTIPYKRIVQASVAPSVGCGGRMTPGPAQLAHNAMPMPAQMRRSREETGQMEEHASGTGLGKFEFHSRVSGGWTESVFRSSVLRSVLELHRAVIHTRLSRAEGHPYRSAANPFPTR